MNKFSTSFHKVCNSPSLSLPLPCPPTPPSDETYTTLTVYWMGLGDNKFPGKFEIPTLSHTHTRTHTKSLSYIHTHSFSLSLSNETYTTLADVGITITLYWMGLWHNNFLVSLKLQIQGRRYNLVPPPPPPQVCLFLGSERTEYHPQRPEACQHPPQRTHRGGEGEGEREAVGLCDG